jgi:hypothetical protein
MQSLSDFEPSLVGRDTKTKEDNLMLKLRLRHGDILIMEEEELQKNFSVCRVHSNNSIDTQQGFSSMKSK